MKMPPILPPFSQNCSLQVQGPYSADFMLHLVHLQRLRVCVFGSFSYFSLSEASTSLSPQHQDDCVWLTNICQVDSGDEMMPSKKEKRRKRKKEKKNTNKTKNQTKTNEEKKNKKTITTTKTPRKY